MRWWRRRYYIPGDSGRQVLTVTKAHVGSQAELDASNRGYALLHAFYVAPDTDWWPAAQALWQAGVRFLLVEKHTSLAPPTLAQFSTGPTPLVRTLAQQAELGRMHWRLRRVGELVHDNPQHVLYRLNGAMLFPPALAPVLGPSHTPPCRFLRPFRAPAGRQRRREQWPVARRGGDPPWDDGAARPRGTPLARWRGAGTDGRADPGARPPGDTPSCWRSSRMLELSVVVCTHERPEDLDHCLASLAGLQDSVEVIVVESASSHPCRALVERYADRIDRLRYVYAQEPGLSVARNAGVAAASQPIIAFIDDDAVPAADWARAVSQAFHDPEVGCIGGSCRAEFSAPRPRWLSDRLLQLAGITRFGERGREPRSSAEWAFGANMAFRSDALIQAGPFCTRLGRRGSSLLSGEDSEMVARILACGWRIWLEPAAVVDHRVSAERCRGGYYWRRLWWNGISRAVNPSARVTVRLLAAVPVRLPLWGVARDRVYLYRLAETAATWPHASVWCGCPGVGDEAPRPAADPRGLDALRRARALAARAWPARRTDLSGRLSVPADGEGDRHPPAADPAARPRRRAIRALGRRSPEAAVSRARRAVLPVGQRARHGRCGHGRVRRGHRRARGVAGRTVDRLSRRRCHGGCRGPRVSVAGLLERLHGARPDRAGAGAGDGAGAHLPQSGAGRRARSAVRRDAPRMERGAGRRRAGRDRGTGNPCLRRPLAADRHVSARRGDRAAASSAGGAGRWARAARGGDRLRCGPAVRDRLGGRYAQAGGGRRVRGPGRNRGRAASGAVAALGDLLSQQWPVLALSALGLLAACWNGRRRAALVVLGAILLLGATYVYRNAGSERYLSELLPIAAVAAGFAVAPALSPARAPEPRARRLHGLWRPLLPVAAIGLTLVITPPRPPLALDTFAALAGPLAQAPAGTLVSAAPDAYGFLLPDRPQQALRPGVRGLILLDGAQRAYDPALGARGVVVARLSAPDGFERPDGSLDTAPVLLIRGVVTAAR